MKKTLWILLALPVLVGFGCAGPDQTAQETATSAASYGGNMAEPATSPRVDAPPITEMSMASMNVQRQVIREGEIGLRVGDVEATEKRVSSMVAKGGGYVESTTSSDLGGNNPSITMTLRVPATGFEDSLSTLAELGHVFTKTVNARDVTAEIVDLGARIKTLSAKEETFREMLRSSRNLNDVMTLQDRLSQVRTEIERMEAQRKSLAGLAALSTIRVTLTQTATVPMAAKDPNWFTNSLGGATTSFMGSLQRLVTVLTWIVVFSPFWLVPILILWWLVKKVLKRIPMPVTE